MAPGCCLTERQRRAAAFGEALRHIENDYVGEADIEKSHRAAMTALVGNLDDPYSVYLTPEQMRREREMTNGTFGGIGMVTHREDGLPVVVRTVPGSPAAQAGIQGGDVVTHVDGEDLRGRSMGDVTDMMRGKVGTPVKLRLLRPETAESFSVTIIRARISLPNVDWRMLEDGIGWLRVWAFHSNCDNEVKVALRKLHDSGFRALVLDLRDDGGGLVNRAQRVADMFLSEGLIFVAHGRDSRQECRASRSVQIDASVPIIVLVNGGTASAAEIVAGALQANGRATVLGTRTYGKGSGTITRRLADGSGVRLTGRRYTLASGAVIEGRGIEPDVIEGELPPLPDNPTPEQITAWRHQKAMTDEQQLLLAVAMLKKKLGVD